MAQYGMLIDLDKCVRCRTCYVICKIMHNIPNQFESGSKYTRLRFIEIEAGKYPSVRRYFIPSHCMHCEDAPCVAGCPTGASYRREDGIIVFDERKCIGCKYCVVVCPYQARYFNKEKGVVDKCNLCVERIDSGLKPYCVERCIGDAITYGDLGDPNSEISKLIASKGALTLSPQLGTKPKVYYAYTG